MEGKSNKFYDQGWFIILSLIILFPLGLYLMWKNKKWTKNLRIVLSVLSVLFFFFWLGSNQPEADGNTLGESENAVAADQKDDKPNNDNHLNEKKEKEQEKKELEEQKKKEEAERKKLEEEKKLDEKKKEEERKQLEEQKKEEEQKKAEEEKQQTSISGNLNAHFIDVGQAESILLEYSGNNGSYNILFDTGDWQRKDVINYLNSQGIKDLDLVIISHPHADHIGQLEHVMTGFNVKEVWMPGNVSTSNVYQRSLEAVLNSDATFYEPKAGETFQIGPVKIEVVHPNHLTGDFNRDSISTRIKFGSVSFLLTGDAIVASENEMINRGNIQADILSLGHHGSNTSTGQSFLNTVKPKIAIYSAGLNNQYGHPHPDVVSRIKQSDIKLYGTDVHGNIIVTTDGKTYTVSTSKKGEVVAKSKNDNEKKKSSTKSNNKPINQTNVNNNHKNNNSSTQKPSKDPSPKNEETNKASGNCVNINTASFEELQNIKHIGPDRAQQIIDLRPFNSVDSLTRVNGIGPARLDDIKAEGKACAN